MNCYLQEGQFKNDELDGFGRKYYGSKYQFIGWMNNAKLHGYCQLIYSNGMVKEGLFKNHKFDDAGNRTDLKIDNSFEELKIDFNEYIIA